MYLSIEGPTNPLIYIKQLLHTLLSYTLVSILKVVCLILSPFILHTYTRTITIILLSPHYSFLSFIFLALFMSFFLFLLLILLVPSSNAQWPPSPGYWPSSRFNSMSFYKGYKNLWGPSHQSFGQNALTIWLDRTSGLTQSHYVYLIYSS